jgi:hypothetical protein
MGNSFSGEQTDQTNESCRTEKQYRHPHPGTVQVHNPRPCAERILQRRENGYE